MFLYGWLGGMLKIHADSNIDIVFASKLTILSITNDLFSLQNRENIPKKRFIIIYIIIKVF